MQHLYIGLMSGTSLDGVDCVCVQFNPTPKLIAHHFEPYSITLKNELQALCSPGHDEINRLGQLDVQLGQLYANSCLKLLEKSAISSREIIAIGSHGQTIRHHPNLKNHAFTLQIGDPNVIAATTGITTVADFRRRDIALQGQGAPLTPAFHHAIFHNPTEARVILNIGGIANITILSPDATHPIFGFDTGPGNTFIDKWIYQHCNQLFDRDGEWAKTGTIHHELLDQLLSDPFFQLPPPKSTGTEYFNIKWLEQILIEYPQLAANDVQATLTQFTVESIALAIHQYAPEIKEILVCGGGVHNHLLIQGLTLALKNCQVHSTSEYGVDPDWVEAIAFAWLAKQTMTKKCGNLPSVTGASRESILGGVYYP